MAKVVIYAARMNAFLNTDPGAQAALAGTAEAVKEGVVTEGPYGVSLSWPKRIPGEPWIRRPMRHGRFKESVKRRKIRQFYRIVSFDAFAHLIEWGSVNNPAYAPFRKTLRKFGGTETVKDESG